MQYCHVSMCVMTGFKGSFKNDRIFVMYFVKLYGDIILRVSGKIGIASPSYTLRLRGNARRCIKQRRRKWAEQFARTSIVQCCLYCSGVDRFETSQDIQCCFDWETPRGRNDVLELMLWPLVYMSCSSFTNIFTPTCGLFTSYICIYIFILFFFYIVIIGILPLHLYWLSEMVKSVASRPLHIFTSAEESPGWDVSSSSV